MRRARRLLTVAALIALTLALAVSPPILLAQEIEPRSYTNTPVGLNFIAFVYGYSTGNVFLDPSLPIEDIDAKLHIGAVRYTRTFSLRGSSANAKVTLPFSAGHWEGLLEGEFRQRDANGVGDVRFLIDVNLYGAPALSVREFASYRQRTIVGVSLLVVAPTGTYDRTKLINLGANRWTFRPQIGVSRALGKWTFEGIGSVWLFGDNDDFFNGKLLSQDPLFVLKGDAVYTFRPGMWLGLGVGYACGGRTIIETEIRQTLQSNYRFGGTFAYAVAPQHGVSFSLVSGVATRAGADFDSVVVAYQYLWGGS